MMTSLLMPSVGVGRHRKLPRSSAVDIHQLSVFDDVMDLYSPDDDVIKREAEKRHSGTPPERRRDGAGTGNDPYGGGVDSASRTDSNRSRSFDADTSLTAGAADLAMLGDDGPRGGDLDRVGDSPDGGRSSTVGGRSTGSGGHCKVCGDEATGMYFGALVCVPCKTFFLRYAGDGFSFVCKSNKDCEISVATRTQCKYCRYQKCLRAGMYRRVRPAQVQLAAGQQLCVVCQDVANGIHFGAITCEGCKKFFRRGLTEHAQYVCKSGQNCVINPRTRNSCRYCRFQTCLRAGMSREAIQMGRPSKVCSGDSTCSSQTPQTPSRQAHSSPTGRHPDGHPALASGSWPPPTTSPYNVDDRLGRWSHDWTTAFDGRAAGDETSPKHQRLSSEGYASSSSPYTTFSPSGSSSTAEHGGGGGGASGGSSGGGESDRSRVSSASSQPDVLNYVGGLPWAGRDGPPTGCGIGAAGVVLGGPGGLLRMSGGELLQRPVGGNDHDARDGGGHGATGGGGAAGIGLLWHVPTCVQIPGGQFALPSPATGSERAVGTAYGPEPGTLTDDRPFQPNEMSDVIENIIKQQQQQQSGMGFGRVGGLVGGLYPGSDGSVRQFEPTSACAPGGGATFADLRNAPVKIEGRPPHQQQRSSVDSSLYPAGMSFAEHPGHQTFSFQHGMMVPPTTTTVASASGGVLTSPGAVVDEQLPGVACADAMFPAVAGTSGVRDAPAGFLAVDPTLQQPAGASTVSPQLDASDWIDQLSEELQNKATRLLPVARASTSQTSAGGDDDSDPDIEQQVSESIKYWLHPELPDENVMLADRHWAVLNQVVPAYNRFVQLGAGSNKTLRKKYEEWKLDTNPAKLTLSKWIQSEVVPVYTMMSYNYFKCLPGFMELSKEDRSLLCTLGQSQSRILVAALHWYDPDERNFRNFLSWRENRPGQVDVFKQKLLEYASRISCEELDSIEAGLLNALIVIATDYPGLQNVTVVERNRMEILSTFRAYTTAKFGTPNTRLETLFQYVPDVRRLGLLHYKMTTRPSLGVTTSDS